MGWEKTFDHYVVDFEPVKIEGRTRFASPGHSVVAEVRVYGRVVMTIKGASINYFVGRASDFVIESLHPTATDDEHDAAIVARLACAGFSLVGFYGNQVEFSCAILSANYYADGVPEPEGSCESCEGDEAHGFMDYFPPDQDWVPIGAEITVRYLQEA